MLHGKVESRFNDYDPLLDFGTLASGGMFNAPVLITGTYSAELKLEASIIMPNSIHTAIIRTIHTSYGPLLGQGFRRRGRRGRLRRRCGSSWRSC